MTEQTEETPLLSWIVKRPSLDIYLIKNLSLYIVLIILISIGSVVYFYHRDRNEIELHIWLMSAGLVLLVTLIGIAIFLAYRKLVHREGITQLFALDSKRASSLYSKNLEGGIEHLVDATGTFTGNAYWNQLMNQTTSKQSIAWKAVDRFSEDPERLVFTLSYNFIPAMRIYCPDPSIYQQARDIIHQHLPIIGGHS